MKSLLKHVCNVSPELCTQEAVNGKVGRTVDDRAQPYYVVEYPGISSNCVREAVLLKYKKIQVIKLDFQNQYFRNQLAKYPHTLENILIQTGCT